MTNKIWLVFYEPHCSHVVQPLDVGVFAALKKQLCTLLRGCATVTLGLPLTKAGMLEAYHQAQLDVMTPCTIKNAWKRAGIYARDHTKPLSWRFVMLESTGVARQPTGTPKADTREKTPNFIADMAAMTNSTPHNGQAFKTMNRRAAMKNPALNNPKVRLMNRKAASLIDKLTDKLAESEARIDYFEAKKSKKTKKLRQKVKITPTEKFARTYNVREAKQMLRNKLVYKNELRGVVIDDEREKTTETPSMSSEIPQSSAPRHNAPRNVKE
ncbi:hypothetical protein GGR50DRAFT_672144 [Xylaria sp. CBS 124048]|nr:hypothetical protein GGR50DRAFT_672144 [Xylaria sp. CBS 124048]